MQKILKNVVGVRKKSYLCTRKWRNCADFIHQSAENERLGPRKEGLSTVFLCAYMVNTFRCTYMKK